MNKQAINDQQLKAVNGGIDNKIVTVKLLIPSGYSDDINIRIYVNGELDRNKNTTIDANVKSVKFTFKGNGTIEVKIKLNNIIYKIFTIDFENDDSLIVI